MAKEKIAVSSLAGGGTVGLAAFGAAVSVVTVNSNTQAYIGSNSVINLTGDLLVSSSLESSVRSEAYAGSGGIVNIGAQAAVVKDTSNQFAFIASGAKIQSADTVTVSASANRNLGSKAAGGGIGGVVVGITLSRATGSGSTEAEIGDGVQVGLVAGKTVRAFSVTADNSTTGSTYGLGVAAGVYAGAGVEATTTINPSAKAKLGANVSMTLTGKLSVTANATPKSSAEAIGAVFSTSVSVGASLPKSYVYPTVEASTGSNFTLNGAAFDLIAKTSTPSGGVSNLSKAFAAVGGALVGISATSTESKTEGSVRALLGDNASINLADRRRFNAISSNVDLVKSNIYIGADHGLETGDEVVYSNGGTPSIGGLTDGATYYVIFNATDDPSTAYNDTEFVKLARTADEADAGTFIQLTSLPPSNSSVSLTIGNSSAIANADVTTDTVNVAASNFTNNLNLAAAATAIIPSTSTGQTPNSVTLATDLGLAEGDRIVYQATGGLRIKGIESGKLTFGSVSISGVSQADGTLSFASPHGLSTGDRVVYSLVSGTAIGNLTSGTTYAVIKVDSTTIKLALTTSESTPITLSGSGFSGSHELLAAHGITQAGVKVRYVVAAGSAISPLVSGKTYDLVVVDAARVKLVDAGVDVAVSGSISATDESVLRQNIGVSENTVYYAKVDSSLTIRLATSKANMAAGTFLPLSATDSALGTVHGFLTPSITTALAMVPDAVSISAETLSFTKGHSYSTGDKVLYSSTSTSLIGLTSGTQYEVLVTSPTAISLRAVGGSTNIDINGSLSGNETFTLQVPTGQTVYPSSIRVNDARILQGDRVLYRKDPSTASSIGLVDDTTYRVLRPSATTVQLVAKYAEASSFDNNAKTLTFSSGHSFTGGEKVIYGYRAPGTFAVTRVERWVIFVSSTQIQLAQTQGGTAVLEASRDDMNPFVHTPVIDLVGNGLDGLSRLTKLTFANGDAVTYSQVPGCLVRPLVSGTTYYVILDPATPDRIKLAGTPSGTAINLTQDAPSFIHSLLVPAVMKIRAESNLAQTAEVRGGQGGLLAVGSNTTTSASTMTVNAELGSAARIVASTLDVSVGGEDRNFAKASSGSGGVISGTAANSSTTTNSTNTVTVKDSGSGSTKGIFVNKFLLGIDKTSRFDGEVDSINASLFGGSGANLANSATSTATITLGARVSAGTITVKNANRARKDIVSGQNVRSGSGGLIDAPAASSTSNVTLNTETVLQSGASLAQTGSYSTAGDFTIDGVNDVSGDDDVFIDSGGAIPVAKGVSKIDAGGYSRIIVNSATLTAVGDLNLTTHAEGNFKTSSTVKVYGLAGGPSGEAKSVFTGEIMVQVNSGALLTAVGDIHLYAGRNRLAKANTSILFAYADLYNMTLLPVADKSAEARVGLDNKVFIASGASVLGVGDINLVADKGFSPVLVGVAKSQNLYQAAFADMSVENTETNNSASSVTINGTVRVGTKRNQKYVVSEKLIDTGTTTEELLKVQLRTSSNRSTTGLPSNSSTNDSTEGLPEPEVSSVDVGASIGNAIELLQQLRSEYSQSPTAVAGYNSRISALMAQARSLGLVEIEDGKEVVTGSLQINYVVIPEIVSGVGSIYVYAENLFGTGIIDAPRDVRVEVYNYSPYSMLLKGIVIPFRDGGKVMMDTGSGFTEISTNTEINSKNKTKNQANFSSITAAGNSGATGSPLQDPVITVKNFWSSTNRTSANDAIFQRLGVSISTINDPDISVQGAVQNLGGTVDLETLGSIVVTGNLNAKTINIKAGRDFSLTTDGFYHVGGDPKGYYTRQYTGPVNRPDLESSQYRSSNTDKFVPGGVVQAGNNIYVAATYININGTMRSGIATTNLTLPSSLDTTINTFKSRYRPGGNKYLTLQRAEVGSIGAVYNAESNRIEVSNAVTRGGYMQLTGQVFSTGNGTLECMDGFGTINIDNQTNFPVVVNKVDTGGEGIEGKIVVIDMAQTDSAGRPLQTVYTRIGDTIKKDSYFEIYNSQTGAVTQSGLSSSTATGRDISATSQLSYQPKTNLRYGWTTGLGTLTQITSVWRTSSSWGGWSYSSDRAPDSADTRALSNSPLLEGDYLRVDSSLSNYFVLGYDNKLLSEKLVRENTEKRTSGWGPWKKTRITYTRVTERSNKDIYLYSIKADNAVGVKFIGSDTGTLSVQSNKSIFINGSLNNPAGSVSVVSRQGSIEYLSSSPIVAKNINLEASTGIGVNTTILTNLTDNRGAGTLNAVTTSGSIRMREMSGALRFNQITTSVGSNVVVSADGSILPSGGGNLVRGRKLDLSSDVGSLGNSSSDPINIVTASNQNGGLMAAAGTSAWINQETGNLRLVSVVARNGDAWVRLGNGGFIDANTANKTDERTYEQLLSVWTAGRLIGADAEKSLSDNIAAHDTKKVAEYKAQFVNLRASYNTRTASGFDNDTFSFSEFHGLATGARVVVNVTGGSIAGLTSGSAYRIIRLSDTLLRLATTDANAEGGIAVDLGAASGTPSVSFVTDDLSSPVLDVSADTFTTSGAHGLATGARVVYRQATYDSLPISSIDTTAQALNFTADPGLATGDKVTFDQTSGATAPGGLSVGGTYFVIRDSATSYRLAATRDASAAGISVSITSAGSGQFALRQYRAAPQGLTDGDTYFAIVVSPTVIELASTRANALAGTAISISDSGGTGAVHSIAVADFDAVPRATNILTFSNAHGLTTGTGVTYEQTAAGGTPIGGLQSGSTYYAIRLDDNSVRLAASADDAVAGNAIDFSSQPAGTHVLKTRNLDAQGRPAFAWDSGPASYNPDYQYKLRVGITAIDTTAETISFGKYGITAVNNANNSLTTSVAHGLGTGDKVVYNGSTDIGGLTRGSTYYAIVLDATTLKLAASPVDAESENAVAITGNISGTQYLTNPLATHAFSNGDTVRYRFGSGSGIGGLTADADYQVEVVDSNTIKLLANGSVVNLSGSLSGEQQLITDGDKYDDLSSRYALTVDELGFSIGGGLLAATNTSSGTETRIEDPNVKSFTGTVTILSPGSAGFIGRNTDPIDVFLPGSVRVTNVSAAANTMTTAASHGWATGRAVKFAKTGGSTTPEIGNVVTGRIYYAIVVSANTIRLAMTQQAASAGNAIDITSEIATANANSYSLIHAEGVTTSGLTDDQKVALASAEQGDVQITYANRNGVVGTVFTIKQRDDIDIHTLGAFSVSSVGQVFLGSEVDLTIGQVSSQRDIVIKVSQNLYATAGTAPNATTPMTIILEAKNGQIGTESVPFRIDLTSTNTAADHSGDDLTARASGDVNIRELTGDLWLGTAISTGGVLRLSAPNGAIRDSIPDSINPYWNLYGTQIVLSALSLGTADNRLDFEQVYAAPDTSRPTKFETSTSGSQYLNYAVTPTNRDSSGVPFFRAVLWDLATSGSGATIDVTSDAQIDVRKVTAASGKVALRSAYSIVDANTSGYDIKALQSLGIISDSMGIGAADALDLDVDGPVTATAAGAIWLNEISNDLQVGVINSTGSSVTLSADRSITDENSSGADILASTSISLSAGTGSIGVADGLEIDLADNRKVTATANGDIWINEQSGDFRTDVISSSAGGVRIDTPGAIVDGNNTDAADIISSSTVTLNATTGGIGEAGLLEIEVTGSGSVNATASGKVWLTEKTGDMLVGRITSNANNVVLTVPGAILAADSSTTPNVEGVFVDLNAGSAIGNSNRWLRTNLKEPAKVTGLSSGALVFSAGHNFSNGDFVGYEILPGTVTTLGGLDVGVRYRARVINSTTLMLQAANAQGTFVDAPATGLFSGGHALLPADGTGSVTASATGDIYLTETTGNLWVGNATTKTGSICLGTMETGNGAQVGVMDAIPDFTNSGSLVFSSNILFAGDYVGTLLNRVDYDQPIMVGNNFANGTNSTLSSNTARDQFIRFSGSANRSAYLTNLNSSTGRVDFITSGDIRLRQANASGTIRLQAGRSIIDDNGDTVNLTSATGADLSVAIGGIGIGDAVETSLGGSQLKAFAALSISVDNISGQLTVDSVTSSGGSVTLRSAGDIADAGDTNIADISAVAGLDLVSTSGAIGALDLEMSTSSRVRSSSRGDVRLRELTGTMLVERIESTLGKVILTSDGGIVDGLGTPDADVIAAAGIELRASSGAIGKVGKLAIAARSGAQVCALSRDRVAPNGP
ncbi:MAG: beta strand repeat-containing protein, partial [Planctomycetota bacterium]